MFKKNNWKEPIDRQDLLYVIFNGIVSSLLAGLLAGSANYLLSLLGVGVDIGFMIIILIVPWRIRNAFYNNHILYALLAIVFLVLSFFISYISFNIISAIVYQNTYYLNAFMDPFYYLLFLIEPFLTMIMGFQVGDPRAIIFGILNIAITCYAFYYTYTSVRNRR